jgi:hypothetical protein
MCSGYFSVDNGQDGNIAPEFLEDIIRLFSRILGNDRKISFPSCDLRGFYILFGRGRAVRSPTYNIKEVICSDRGFPELHPKKLHQLGEVFL